MKSWKTTMAGIASILLGALRFFVAIKNNNLTDEAFLTGGAAITTGVGLLTAKDNNVTGGTVVQEPKNKMKDFLNGEKQ